MAAAEEQVPPAAKLPGEMADPPPYNSEDDAGRTLHAEDVVKSLRTTFRTGRTLTYEWRVQQLNALKAMVFENQEQIEEALFHDLHKPAFEVKMTETGHVFAEIDWALSHLKTWMAPETQSAPSVVYQIDSLQLHKDPLGVCLIITPWNYPVMLSLTPLTAALAAGCCVVLKPSEVSSACERVMSDLIPRYLDRECVRVMTGGVPETTALLQQRWDGINYTGNGTVARIVAAAAARHLTRVTLELGGKSPVIIDRGVNLATAARRVVWGRFINAGQSCVAPDYVLIHPRDRDEFVRQATAVIAEFFGDNAKASESYGRIINRRHWNRLNAMLEDGAVVAVGGTRSEEDLYIEPTILVDVTQDHRCMQEEIFGPILPIVTMTYIDTCIDFINDNPKPLAMYVFSPDKDVVKRILANTSSGQAVINDTIIQHSVLSLPFGGVGDSGQGANHGVFGFEAFTHKKAVMNRSSGMEFTNDLRYPPYTNKKEGQFKWVTGYPSSIDNKNCAVM